MITETEFEQYKEQVKKENTRRARTTATVFGVLATIALIALVYAFFQNATANRARLMAEKTAIEAIQQRAIAERATEEARQSRADCAASMKQLQEEFTGSQKKPVKH